MVAADAVRPVEVKLKSNKTMNHGNDFRSYDIVTIAVTSRDGLAKQLLENDPTPLRMVSRTFSQPGLPPTFSSLNRRIISVGDTNFQRLGCGLRGGLVSQQRRLRLQTDDS